MWSHQVFIAILSACLMLQYVAAVVNSGQTKKIEDSDKSKSDRQETDETNAAGGDLLAESSETANRREAPTILDFYGPPSSSSSGNEQLNLPIPLYGVPDAPSNNVIYPTPPPDIPPPPPKLPPSYLYGAPSPGKLYGVPQVNLPSRPMGYGMPPPNKYGSPSFSYNQFPTKFSYGPPKSFYGPPVKPIKYNKYPAKNFGLRPPKPIYGVPSNFKDTFSYNKLNTNNNLFNNLNLGNFHTKNNLSPNSFSNLYSSLSSLNHQYGTPISSSGQSLTLDYGTPSTGVSPKYGIPEKVISSGPQLVGYGPPQPSPNPKPPHPGAPAPPTPPDIKYDGWQPIPGLVSNQPSGEFHQHADQGVSYQDLSPPPLSIGHSQISSAHGSLSGNSKFNNGNSLLSQPGVSDSYGVPPNAFSEFKGGKDSYSAPLGTVTGSGGIVASSGVEAQGAPSHSIPNAQGSTHAINLDLSTIGVSHGSDIQAIKSIEYDITPHLGSSNNGGNSAQIANIYGVPKTAGVSSGNAYASSHSYNSLGSTSSHSYKKGIESYNYKSLPLSGATLGLVPPSGIYGAPPSSRYGTPLYTQGSFKEATRPSSYTTVGKETYNTNSFIGSSEGNSYLPPSPPIQPSTSYGVPSGGSAISFQNIAHGSSTAGIDLHHTSLNIAEANALPLSSYTVPLGAIDGSYSLPPSGDDNTISIDYSHPPVSIDLTQEKQSTSHDCYEKQQLQVPSLAYGVPSADSYTSSLSSLSTNIRTPQAQTLVTQATYGTPNLIVPQPQNVVPSSQYGVPDLLHSSSVKAEAKFNSVIESEESHGKDYGKSVAASFGPNSELVESQSIDLNNIPLQGNLGSYTLQIQSADGGTGQVSHTQVLNEGLLQSILQAIEQPSKQSQNTKYPIILQPSIERDNYSFDQSSDEPKSQGSEIKEVIVEAPKDTPKENDSKSSDNEETLQLLDTSNIALYYRNDNDMKKETSHDKSDENSVDFKSEE